MRPPCALNANKAAALVRDAAFEQPPKRPLGVVGTLEVDAASETCILAIPNENRHPKS